MLSGLRKKHSEDKPSNVTPSPKTNSVNISRCTNFLCNVPGCKDHTNEDFSTKKKKENFLKSWNWAMGSSLEDIEALDCQSLAETHNGSKSNGPKVTTQGTY